ncbi:MAG: hypothetical protein KC590_03060 [Nitrospira sp.]|nr:hypothetical protein [Nitrospira sp.]
MKIIRTVLIIGVIFGLGYYTGQKPEEVKQKLREFSGVVLENTIGGVDQQTRVQRQILHAQEGLLEGKAFLLDHRFVEATEEFERALHHLDQASMIDPQSPLGQKIEMVKVKVQEARQNLAEGRTVHPRILEDLRQELQNILP